MLTTLHQYENTLLALHRSMLVRKEAEAEEESLRGQLEEQEFGCLTEVERELMAELSEDLYVAEEEFIPRTSPSDSTEAQVQRWNRVAMRARTLNTLESTQLRELLRDLRTLPSTILTNDKRAYILGRVWSTIGFHAAAARFLDYAGVVGDDDNIQVPKIEDRKK